MKNRKMIIASVLLLVILIIGVSYVMLKNKTPEKKEAYQPGTIEGNHYENLWLGLKFDAPEGFHMYSREELKERTTDAADTDTQAKASDMSMDMCAVSDQVGSVTITVESRGDSDKKAAEYAEEFRREQLKNDGENMKFQNKGEISEVTLAGESYTCLKLEYVLDDLKMCNERYIRMKDDCVVIIELQYEPGDNAGRNLMYQSIAGQ